MSSNSGHILQFKDFTIDIDQKVLLRGGVPIALAPKVFETLLVLIENHGRIVLKEELMKRLWPDTFVEESNLTFNIQQLRKSLGDNARKPIYVETIPRRGYRFIAGVEPEWTSQTGVHGNGLPQDPTRVDGDAQVFESPIPQANQPTDVLTAPQAGPPARMKFVTILVAAGVAIAVIGLV